MSINAGYWNRQKLQKNGYSSKTKRIDRNKKRHPHKFENALNGTRGF